MANSSSWVREMLVASCRHKRKIAVIGVTVVGCTLFALAIWPRTYESEAKLLVRLGRESVALDPTATTGQTIAFQKQQEEEINSVLGVLNSRETVERIVAVVGAKEVLAPPTFDQAVTDSTAASPGPSIGSRVSGALDVVLSGVGLRDPVSERETAVRKLEARLQASAGLRSGVVTISCLAPTPQSAQKLASTATTVFLEHHVSLTRTAGSHDFFSEQSELLKSELATASAVLRDRKTDYSIVNVAGEQAKLLQALSNTELAALETDRQLTASRTRMQELRGQIAELPEQIVSGSTTGANLARSRMLEKLFELQTHEQELLALMTKNHPSVGQVRAQREEMERIMAEQEPDSTASTEAPNPVRQALEGEVLREHANVEAFAKQKEVLAEQLAELKQKTEALNAREVELAGLQREVDALESKYQTHIDNLEQARIGDALEAEQISSINLAQPATLVERPVSPNKRVAFAAGLLLALVVSFGTAFGLEQADPTLRTPEHLESQLDLPVIASLPVEGTQRRGRETSISANELRTLAGRLRWLDIGNGSATEQPSAAVAIVNCGSTLPGSVAAHLAVDATQLSGDPVLLVDADSASRRAGDRFGANGAVGLADILGGRADVESCVRDSGHTNLSLITSGTSQAAETVMDLRQIRNRLSPVTDRYGLVIAELPAVGTSGSEAIAARDFDAVILVVESERTRADDAKRIKRQLTESGANVLGCVLYGQRDYLPSWLNNMV